MKKEIFLILLIFFLVFLQQSFLPYFTIWGMVPNLVFILVFIINVLDYKSGIILSFLAGLILDIYSGLPLGVSALLFLIMAIFIKKSLRFFQKLNILYLIFIFSSCLVFYNLLLSFVRIKL